MALACYAAKQVTLYPTGALTVGPGLTDFLLSRNFSPFVLICLTWKQKPPSPKEKAQMSSQFMPSVVKA